MTRVKLSPKLLSLGRLGNSVNSLRRRLSGLTDSRNQILGPSVFYSLLLKNQEDIQHRASPLKHGDIVKSFLRHNLKISGSDKQSVQYGQNIEVVIRSLLSISLISQLHNLSALMLSTI